MRAQTLQTAPASGDYSAIATKQNSRITCLLEQLADQAGSLNNLTFAVRAQSQAASLLWTRDRDRARAIYRRAFESLEPALSKSRDETPPATKMKPGEKDRALSDSERKQLRSELLNQIASHDPGLAEDLARGLIDDHQKTGCPGNGLTGCGSDHVDTPTASVPSIGPRTQRDAERCDLLMSTALQIVERDPLQAMSLAQTSISLGVSPNLARLLTSMRTIDPELADLLFSNVLARLETDSRVELNDIRTLGSYVVWVTNSSSTQPMNKALVVRYLNFAFGQVVGRNVTASTAAGVGDESSQLYFVGRQLTDMFARYLPERLGQVQHWVSEQSEGVPYDNTIDSIEGKTRAPSDLAWEALDSTDGAERDSLNARAALSWLSRGEIREAQAAALKIFDPATRDRVLIPIARRYSSEKHLEDAVGVVRRIANETSRADLLVLIAGAALSSKNNIRAVELLNEAEKCSIEARPTRERAQSLVKIAGSFSTFDTARSFDVLQSAVKAINEFISEQERSIAELSASGSRAKPVQVFSVDELYSASLESTLAALAKTNFDGALALAQQLPGEEASVIAQLAVCGGGLSDRGFTQPIDDERDPAVNP